MDGGIIPPANATTTTDPGPGSAVVTVSDNKHSQYQITFVNRNNNTWSYQVQVISGWSLENWQLNIGACQNHIVGSNPADATISAAGIKWVTANGGAFSLTLDGSYQFATVTATLQNSKGSAQVSISGPDCTQPIAAPAGPTPGPTPTPTATPDPDGTTTSGLCPFKNDGTEYKLWDKNSGSDAPGAFGWLTWNGSPSNSTLVDNIFHPENSGVWHIGDWVHSGPGVQNSSGVSVALDYWINANKLVTIPLYDQLVGNGSNAVYRICAFAEFKLTEYNFQGSDKWVKGSFVSRWLRAR